MSQRLSKAMLAYVLLYEVCLHSDREASSAPPRRARVATSAQSDLSPPPKATVLVGIGDSLTHGTMDATTNSINTRHAYLQRVFESLDRVTTLEFKQPLLNLDEQRIGPAIVPTNLGVNDSEVFKAEGLEYYSRYGNRSTVVSSSYLCDRVLPIRLDDKYDRVLYPINLLNLKAVSQMDAAEWWLKYSKQSLAGDNFAVVLWLGNNDSSVAALGEGGANPAFIPLPFTQISDELTPEARALLSLAEENGLVSFAPYTPQAIERNLTRLEDFEPQFNKLLNRLTELPANKTSKRDLFVLTLPYYHAAGYLMDSEDIEYYLYKLDPNYSVPPTFNRVAPRGEPITDALQGDRISLITFGMMYTLLATGSSIDEVNSILEAGGQQVDGLVLSELEQRTIAKRIDDFNQIIADAVAVRGGNCHLVDVGGYLNDALTGQIVVTVGGRILSRKWIRGNSFSFDGVHPNYTAQVLVANYLLMRINQVLQLNGPLFDPEVTFAGDPYIDRDGDGWAPGPPYEGAGITGLLFLFKDPDDTDSAVGVAPPDDVWLQISNALVPRVRPIVDRGSVHNNDIVR